MIDEKSEISIIVFKCISEFNNLLHSCGRLEGSQTTENDNYSSSLRLPLPQALDRGPQASELIVVVVEFTSIVLL
jgi:hypothetical protein